MQALLHKTDLARGRKTSSLNILGNLANKAAGRKMSTMIGASLNLSPSSAAASDMKKSKKKVDAMEGKLGAMEKKLNTLANETQTMRGDMKKILRLLQGARGVGGGEG